MKLHIGGILLTARMRAFLGFLIGLLVMIEVVQVFLVNGFDFFNMQHGVRLLLTGINPWALDTRIPHFYNPPFSVLFLWPMLFTSPKFFIVVGGALLSSFVFYRRSWPAFAWFATNTFLWVVASGGIDMFIIGAGMLLLLAADNSWGKWYSVLWRVLGYGILLIKPQGGLFIVALFLLLHKDWKGFLISVFVYGVPFLPLYPDWIYVVLNDPPLAQTVASHTILAKLGVGAACFLALLVLFARNWKYWQIAGALSGILMPYGMPGLPIFLTLTGVKRLKVIPILIIFSGFLASLTWINLPEGLNNSDYGSHLMSIYHLGMLSISITFACISDGPEEGERIMVGNWVKNAFLSTYQYVKYRTKGFTKSLKA